jgi:hypothetical protein
MSEIKKMSKEEVRNIGECLLECICSHRYAGGFDNRCYWFDGEQPWAYHKDKYLIKIVCELFSLDYKEQLYNFGYSIEA